MLNVLFTQDDEVEDLFCDASPGPDSRSSAIISSPVQDDFQHAFTWMTYEANSSVALAERWI